MYETPRTQWRRAANNEERTRALSAMPRPERLEVLYRYALHLNRVWPVPLELSASYAEPIAWFDTMLCWDVEVAQAFVVDCIEHARPLWPKGYEQFVEELTNARRAFAARTLTWEGWQYERHQLITSLGAPSLSDSAHGGKLTLYYAAREMDAFGAYVAVHRAFEYAAERFHPRWLRECLMLLVLMRERLFGRVGNSERVSMPEGVEPPFMGLNGSLLWKRYNS